MTYLVEFLVGEDAGTSKGLQLSNENYTLTLNTFKDRFGDPQLLISTHNPQLKIVISGACLFYIVIEVLKEISNEVETQVRSLEIVQLDSKNYCCLLVLVLINKPSDELKLIISLFHGNLGRKLEKLDKLYKFLEMKLKREEQLTLKTK